MKDNDPFSMVYNALWSLVERNENLRDYIPIGNRIKFDEENAVKNNIADADVPELALLVNGGSFNINNTNTTTAVTRNYVWTLVTGSYRVNEIYNRICFELLRSMVDYNTCLCGLQWCNCNFVQAARLTSCDDGPEMQSLMRNIAGWAGLWSVEVDMVFPTNALRI